MIWARSHQERFRICVCVLTQLVFTNLSAVVTDIFFAAATLHGTAALRQLRRPSASSRQPVGSLTQCCAGSPVRFRRRLPEFTLTVPCALCQTSPTTAAPARVRSRCHHVDSNFGDEPARERRLTPSSSSWPSAAPLRSPAFASRCAPLPSLGSSRRRRRRSVAARSPRLPRALLPSRDALSATIIVFGRALLFCFSCFAHSVSQDRAALCPAHGTQSAILAFGVPYSQQAAVTPARNAFSCSPRTTATCRGNACRSSQTSPCFARMPS